MKLNNSEIRGKIEKNKKIFTALRRADVALQIRGHMVEKGVRNIDIAERLGVSEANVSRWLRGNQNISIDALYMLADAIEENLTIVVGSKNDARGELEFHDPEGSGVWQDESAAHESHDNVVSMSEYVRHGGLISVGGKAKFKPAISTHIFYPSGGFDERAVATA